MAETENTRVKGVEEEEVTEVQRKRRRLIFFKVKVWEEVSAKHLGNDIHISTSKEIREVYLNGKSICKPRN